MSSSYFCHFFRVLLLVITVEVVLSNERTFRLFHTGNTAGNVEEISIFRVGRFGGFARIATVLKEAEANATTAGEPLLRLDNGMTLGSLVWDIYFKDGYFASFAPYTMSNSGFWVDAPPVGPYPMRYVGADAMPVFIFGIDKHTRMVGSSRLTFDSDGHLFSHSGDTIVLNSCNNVDPKDHSFGPCIEENPDVKSQVSLWSVEVDKFKGRKLGESKQELPFFYPNCRYMECAGGNFITDAIRSKMQGQCDLAVMNSGGIRAPLPRGNVTLGDLLSIHFFGNSIALFQIRGVHLMSMLLHSFSGVPSNLTAQAINQASSNLRGDGRFLQMSGIRLQYDLKLTQNRIVAVWVNDEPISLTRVYSVCANNYLRQGGDGYGMLRDEAINPLDFGPTIISAMKDYLTAMSPIDVPEPGRIVTVDSTLIKFFCSQGCHEEGGSCIGVDNCECNNGWIGPDCSISEFDVVPVVVPIVVGVVVVTFVIGVLVRKRMVKKFQGMYRKVIDYSEIDVVNEIGRGSFGVIYWGKWRGISVAVKQILFENHEENDVSLSKEDFNLREAYTKSLPASTKSSHSQKMSYFKRVFQNFTDSVSSEESWKASAFHDEIGVMCSLRHFNVLLYMGSTLKPLCIVTEFMQRGSLQDILFDTSQVLSWHRRLSLLRDTSLGMQYLHEHKPQLLHCDLKTANVLVNSQWMGKVCDFGMSALVGHFDPTEMVGTFLYLAPEVGKSILTDKSDVFSFGIMMAEVVNRLVPYLEILRNNVSSAQIALAVSNDGLRPSFHTTPPKSLKNLIVKSWDTDPNYRPPFSDISSALEDMLRETWGQQTEEDMNNKTRDIHEEAKQQGERNAIISKIRHIINTLYKKNQMYRTVDADTVDTFDIDIDEVMKNLDSL